MYLDCWTLQNVCCHPELRQTPHITPKTYEDIQKKLKPIKRNILVVQREAVEGNS
jgi:hypothetical protein